MYLVVLVRWKAFVSVKKATGKLLKNIELQINRLLNQPAAFYLRGGGKKIRMHSKSFRFKPTFRPLKRGCLFADYPSIYLNSWWFPSWGEKLSLLGAFLKFIMWKSLLATDEAVCLDLSELRFSLCELRLAIIWLKTETNWHLIILFNRTQSSGYCAPIIIDLGAMGWAKTFLIAFFFFARSLHFQGFSCLTCITYIWCCPDNCMEIAEIAVEH